MVSQRPSAPSMNFIPGEDWPYKAVTEIPPENEKTELHRTCDQMADQILSEIINDAMDQRQKQRPFITGYAETSVTAEPQPPVTGSRRLTRASGCGGATALLIILYPSCF